MESTKVLVKHGQTRTKRSTYAVALRKPNHDHQFADLQIGKVFGPLVRGDFQRYINRWSWLAQLAVSTDTEAVIMLHLAIDNPEVNRFDKK